MTSYDTVSAYVDKLPGVAEVAIHNHHNWDRVTLNPIQPMNDQSSPRDSQAFARLKALSTHIGNNVNHGSAQSLPITHTFPATPPASAPDEDSSNFMAVVPTGRAEPPEQCQCFSLDGFELREKGYFEFCEKTDRIMQLLIKPWTESCNTFRDLIEMAELRLFELDKGRKGLPAERSPRKKGSSRSPNRQNQDKLRADRKSLTSKGRHCAKEQNRRSNHWDHHTVLHRSIMEPCHLLAATQLETDKLSLKWQQAHHLYLEGEADSPPPALPSYEELFREKFVELSKQTRSKDDKPPGKNEQFIGSQYANQLWAIMTQILLWAMRQLLRDYECMNEEHESVKRSNEHSKASSVPSHVACEGYASHNQTVVHTQYQQHDSAHQNIGVKMSGDSQTYDNIKYSQRSMYTPPMTPDVSTGCNNGDNDYTASK